MRRRQAGLLAGLLCAAALASVVLVGSRIGGGEVELREDGKWYYGTFIPTIHFSPPQHPQLQKHTGAEHRTPAKAPAKAEEDVKAVPVVSKAEEGKVVHKKAAPTAAESKVRGGGGAATAAKPAPAKPAPAKPAAHSAATASAAGAASTAAKRVAEAVVHKPMSKQERLRQRVDAKLASLQAGAKQLGVDFKGKASKLDDLPLPNIEPGTDSTPETPWPEARGGRRKQMLEEEQEEEQEAGHESSGKESYVTDEDWDKARKLQGEGVNVHTGFKAPPGDAKKVFAARGAPFLYDHQVPVAEVDGEYPEPYREPEPEAEEPEEEPASKEEEEGHVEEGKEEEKEEAPQEEEEVEAPSMPASNLSKIGLHQASKASKLFQVAPDGASPASPDYLEPQKHQSYYNAAWKWAAKMRDVAKKGKQGSEQREGGDAEDKAHISQLAGGEPCPWYGCRDGSGSVLAPPKALAVKHAPPKHAAKGGAAAAAHAAAGQKKLAAAAVAKPGPKAQQLHLAHGYGTTNGYTAKPLTPNKDQYYGGDHRFYGSEFPVNSHEGKVRGDHEMSNSMESRAYDAGGAPTSFDSVPLADESTFAARVAKHQPQGENGKLDYAVRRKTLLSAWRKYEGGLTECMEAESTLDPSLKDYACNDVNTGLSYLQACMKNHHFGLASVPAARDGEERGQGAWGALPTLLAASKQLDGDDYRVVHSVLSKSAVFSTLWRLENLHARCVATGSAYRPEGLTRVNEVRRMDGEIKSMDRSLTRDHPGTESMRIGEARLQGAFHGAPWEFNSVQRGASRNYWPNVMSAWPLDGSTANIPATNEYYGDSTGYEVAPVDAKEASRKDLPHWREPMGAQQNPAGVTGTSGDYTMQQPRAALEAQGPGFPVRVNGRSVDPNHPRPFQVQSGALTGYAQHYTWSGPGAYDYVPLAHPDTVRQGYHYPTTLWPEVGEECMEDRNCGLKSVCGSAGICVEWDEAVEPYRAPAQGGHWPTNVTPDWV